VGKIISMTFWFISAINVLWKLFCKSLAVKYYFKYLIFKMHSLFPRQHTMQFFYRSVVKWKFK
jgi:hypothetical protein